MLNRIRALTAATLAACAFAALPAASAQAADNVAVAQNTRDGSTVFRISFKLVRAPGDVVDDANAAVAIASCDSCQTTAIAIEGVLVFGDPTTFTPLNLAIAENIDCTNCQTLAYAYQQ